MTRALNLHTTASSGYWQLLLDAYPAEMRVVRPSESALMDVEIGVLANMAADDESDWFLPEYERREIIANRAFSAILIQHGWSEVA